MNRRFPPPWTIEEANNACFIVKDANGLEVSYVYFEDEPGRRTAAGLLSRDEARRIAVTNTALVSEQDSNDSGMNPQLALRVAYIAARQRRTKSGGTR